MSKEARSYDLLWLSISLIFVLALYFSSPIKGNDYWWYLRIGRDVLSTGSVPSVETISYSRAGDYVMNQQWLAGVIFFVVYQYGGVTLTYLLAGFSLALAYGLIWWIMRQASGPRLATILVYILVICTSNNWTLRPQLLTYPLFVLSIWSVYQWQAGKNQYLFYLPLGVLLWVNVHGSFILPFALAGSALLFGRGERKPLLIAFGAMILVTLLNPYGPGVWRFITLMLNSESNKFSVEWLPPNIVEWQNKIFFGWLLGFAPLSYFSQNKLSLLEWVWFLGFGWLALSGIRYVIWFMFLLSIFSAKFLAYWSNETIDRPVQRTSFIMNNILSLFIIMLSFTYLPGVRGIWQEKSVSPYDPITTPVDAVAWLDQHSELSGPLWNDYAYGSYLSFAMPSRKVWIDTRAHIYPTSQWNEYLRVNNAEGWQETFDRVGVNLLLLSFKRQAPLIAAVAASDVWCRQYKNDYAIIYARCDPIP